MTMTDMASAATGQDAAVASGKGPRAGQPKRRAFTAAYKTRILREYDQLQTGHERGALLRREGLYTSHIADWRRTRDAGAAGALKDKPAGRQGRSAEAVENERLRKENDKLTAELTRTRAAPATTHGNQTPVIPGPPTENPQHADTQGCR
jgi:transposase